MSEPKTCGSCAHWRLDPIDPQNLSAPRQGECRQAPPVPLAVVTSQGLSVMVVYPKIPPQFPACGQHAGCAPKLFVEG